MTIIVTTICWFDQACSQRNAYCTAKKWRNT